MKELYINGRLVDLNESDNPIAMTYAVNNLAEIKDRQANFSNIFKCPATENNRETFGYADSIAFTQNQPYRVLPAKLIQQGIEIIPRGLAIIQSVGKYFEVQVLSGIKDFLSLIENKYISDLTFPEHTWNLNTAVNSQANTGIFNYPVIDYGSLSDLEKVVDVRQLRPAVFNKDIISRILIEAGYTFEGAIFSDPFYNSEIIPFANDKFEHNKLWIANIKKKDLRAYQTNSISITAVQGSNPSIPQSYYYSGSFPFNNAIIEDPLFTSTIYTANQRTFVRASVNFPSITTTKVGSVGPGEMYVGFYKNNGGAGPGTFFFQTGYKTYTDTSLTFEGMLNPGDTLTIHLVFVGLKVVFAPTVSFTIENGSDVFYLQDVQVAAILPRISQKDHLKDFMQRYCLTPVVDNYRKKIYFKSFAELYANKSIAKDWTDKFTNKIPESKFSFGNYGQINFGKYKEDENVNSDLGLGSFPVDNQTLKSENDAIVSQFAATESIIKLDGVIVPLIKKISDPSKLAFTIKTEPRILINRIIQNPGISFTDGTSTITPASVSIPYFAQAGVDGLSFAELFTRHYNELISRMLAKARVVTREVILNEEDLASLDHFIPIYDANEACYFYLNKISDYIEGEPAKCEFIIM